ncbi:IS110 family RNA-guided transposase [Humisphaera borealis]|uniref:IS110 family transposase n=1 Tax=Humisphaera borealis TaxID=2807512 RepID=A0A7M2WWJ1_9BACT|nr:IS110 family transposase [Humisphaera borealis]QOV89773.1 IS110 family transposase [Humisphaera borealis]
MSLSKIIALDLGKFKTVCCVMDAATRESAFETVQTSPVSLHELIVKQLPPSPADALVVFETCDLAGWVHDLCQGLGVKVIVTHANGEAWQWRRVKRKTDRDDALKLAKLALLDQLGPVHMPSPDQRQRRRLVLHRRSVVTRRTQSRNAIRAIFNQQGLSLAKGGKQWTIAGLTQLREHARPLADCDLADLWRGQLEVELSLMQAADAQLKVLDAKLDELGKDDARIQLLQTVKGVGPRVAEVVVLHLDDPHRFKSADHVAGYAGLVPKQIESGQMSRFGHITGRGPALLRSMLVEAAWVVWRHNAWAQAWVAKISRGSRARRKIAMVALARKLLTMLWSMMKHNRPFQTPISGPPMAALPLPLTLALA